MNKYQEAYNKGARDILKVIKEEPPINQWIPCKEKLPKNMETVIFTTEDGKVECGWYDEKKNWCVNDSYFPGAFTFIAWQPLPKPYEEKENVD